LSDAPVWTVPGVADGMSAEMPRLQRLLDEGQQLLGWKVGFGSAAAQASLGITAPLVGYLTSAGVLPDSATVALGEGWTRPVLEAEIAVRIGRDLAGPVTRQDARRAVVALAAAIELVDVDRTGVGVSEVLDTNIFHRHVVFGGWHDISPDFPLTQIGVRVDEDGREVVRSDEPAQLTGDLVELVAHVAGWLHAAGTGLQAGQVIITGAAVPPRNVEPGVTCTVTCPPLGDCRVTFV
jgi:2-keto-4-pentenoate hydratase